MVFKATSGTNPFFLHTHTKPYKVVKITILFTVIYI
jgi:hypothetical protein